MAIAVSGFTPFFGGEPGAAQSGRLDPCGRSAGQRAPKQVFFVKLHDLAESMSPTSLPRVTAAVGSVAWAWVCGRFFFRVAPM